MRPTPRQAQRRSERTPGYRRTCRHIDRHRRYSFLFHDGLLHRTGLTGEPALRPRNTSHPPFASSSRKAVASRTKACGRFARRDDHHDSSTCALIEVCRSPFDFPKDWLKCYPISTPFRTGAGCEPARRGRTSGVGCDGQFKVTPQSCECAAFVSMCAQKVIRATGPDDSKIETQGISTFKILVRLLLIDSCIGRMLAPHALGLFLSRIGEADYASSQN